MERGREGKRNLLVLPELTLKLRVVCFHLLYLLRTRCMYATYVRRISMYLCRILFVWRYSVKKSRTPGTTLIRYL